MVGPQLHRGCSQGVGGLPRIPPLHPPVAHSAATDRNFEAPPDGLAHDLGLKLRSNFFHLQRASAGTLQGWRHGDYFIDLLGNGFAVTLARRRCRTCALGVSASVSVCRGKTVRLAAC
jgi:hypothetical protein